MKFMTASFFLIIAAFFCVTGAYAGPFEGADCVAFSGENMTGTAYAVAHDGDVRAGYQRGQTKTTFTPKSLYVANGYAAKIYSGPYYNGEVALLGDAGQLAASRDFSHLRDTDGGHYVNLTEYWPGVAVASYSCTDAGERITQSPSSFMPTFIAYNTKVFTIESYQNLHGNTYDIRITHLNNQSQLTIKVRQIDSQSGSDTIIDLATGEIAITEVQPNNIPGDAEAVKAPAQPYGLHLAYSGAVSAILDVLTASLNNNKDAIGTFFTPDANPELVPVMTRLADFKLSL